MVDMMAAGCQLNLNCEDCWVCCWMMLDVEDLPRLGRMSVKHTDTRKMTALGVRT